MLCWGGRRCHSPFQWTWSNIITSKDQGWLLERSIGILCRLDVYLLGGGGVTYILNILCALNFPRDEWTQTEGRSIGLFIFGALAVGLSPRKRIPEDRAVLREGRNGSRCQTQARWLVAQNKQEEMFCKSFKGSTQPESQHLGGVLVFWGCHNKRPQTVWLNRKLSAQSVRDQKPSFKVQAESKTLLHAPFVTSGEFLANFIILGLVDTPLHLGRHSHTAFSLALHIIFLCACLSQCPLFTRTPFMLN